MAYVQLTNVGIEFPLRGPSFSSREALAGVNLKLSSGDRLGVLGLNGSGKTTLLRVITGVYPAIVGEVTREGTLGSMLDLHAGIHGKMSGRDNITYRSKLLGRSKQLSNETVEDACEFGELAEFIDQPVETYSSGMKMRLAFSIATAVPSEILVMDEWLSVGDDRFQARAKQRIDSLVQQAEILVIASHNKELLSGLCNRFLHLEKGRATLSSSVEN
jgi:lipopolysaccharide transport system ATP-binding protein